MSLYGCGDPKCLQCNPSSWPMVARPLQFNTTSAPYTVNFAWDPGLSGAIANAFKLPPQDLGLPKLNKEQSMSSVAQRIVADLQSLDEKDFPAISKEIDNIKARRKDSIEENLDGVARMACKDISTPELRPFVLSYFKDGKVNTVQGVELGNSSAVPENEEGKEYRVYAFGRNYPVTGTHYTIRHFEKALKDSNIPYAFVYRNKNKD